MKKFNAVMFQRKVREELSKKYIENREAFLSELKERYGKYKIQKKHHKLHVTASQGHPKET